MEYNKIMTYYLLLNDYKINKPDKLIPVYSAFNGFSIYKTTKFLNFDTATVDELKKLKEINYNGIKKYDHTVFWGKDPDQPTQGNGELSVDEQIKSLEMMNQNIINSIKQGFILPSNGGTNFKRFG